MSEMSAEEERIRLRAYELYVARGEHPGREREDWLEAERELLAGQHAEGNDTVVPSTAAAEKGVSNPAANTAVDPNAIIAANAGQLDGRGTNGQAAGGTRAGRKESARRARG